MPQRTIPDEAVLRLARSIELQLTRNVRIRELCRALGCSRYQLTRAFRRTVGLPPHRFLVRRRVERAKALLLEGASAIDAALGAGFYDQSHLIRCFRQHEGTSPGRYLRARRREEPSGAFAARG